MRQVKIGERSVSAIGLGEMPLSVRGRPEDEGRALRTVAASLDAGVTLIDTADAYCLTSEDFGHGEQLIAKALAAWGGDTDQVLVATKGGHRRGPDGDWTVDGRPEYLRTAAQESAKRLGVEAIGLYQHHRPDPAVPYAETIGALAELLDAGTIQMAGISNATVAQIDEAQRILGGRLASVQNQFAPNFRSSEGELRHCGEIGVAFLPWSPLGGIGRSHRVESHEAFAAVAREHGVSPQQVVLAWMLSKGDHVAPIPGSSRPETATASAEAAGLTLTPEQIARLDAP